MSQRRGLLSYLVPLISKRVRTIADIAYIAHVSSTPHSTILSVCVDVPAVGGAVSNGLGAVEGVDASSSSIGLRERHRRVLRRRGADGISGDHSVL